MLWPTLQTTFRRDPFREMNRLLGFLADELRPAFPPVDISTSDDAVLVKAALPGVAPEALDVSVEGNVLTIRGERASTETTDTETVHRMERHRGTFLRTIELPYPVEPEQIEGSYMGGILRVRLPRAATDRPRRIAINRNEGEE